MTLFDAVAQAGGINSEHKFINAEIARHKKGGKTNTENNISIINKTFENIPSTFNSDNKKDILLSPNDHIIIRNDPYPIEKKSVNISGYVMYPGDYIDLSCYQSQRNNK